MKFIFGPRDLGLLIGRRGSGKSFLGKQIQSLYPKRVVFDTLDEYPPPPTNLPNPEAEREFGIHVYSYAQFATQLLRLEREGASHWWIVYHFDLETDGELEEFNQVLRVLFHLGNVHVTVEEVQTFTSPHFMPQWLRHCVFRGRHRNMGMLFTTQCPGELNKRIFSQCAYTFVGSLHEPHDVKYCVGFLGDRADELLTIEPRWFLLFRPGPFPIVKIYNSLA